MSGVTLTLLLALLAAPSAALLAAPQSPHAPTLQLRGGVGGVDPVVVAKIATGLEMAHSSFTVLAPEKAGEAYGLQGMSALTTWIVEGIGMQNLARAVFAANMLRGCALPRAMAWSLVPQLVGNLQDVLQDKTTKCNVGREGLYAGILLDSGVAFLCFSGAATAETAIKAHVGWSSFSALLMMAAPRAARGWGVPDASATDVVFIRALGWEMAAYAATVFAALQSGNAVLSVGVGSAVSFLSHFESLFFSRGPQKIGAELGLQIAWLAISAAVSVFTICTPSCDFMNDVFGRR